MATEVSACKGSERSCVSEYFPCFVASGETVVPLLALQLQLILEFHGEVPMGRPSQLVFAWVGFVSASVVCPRNSFSDRTPTLLRPLMHWEAFAVWCSHSGWNVAHAEDF